MLGKRTIGPQNETGLVRETKWGQTPVSFQAWFVRPSGLCFIGDTRKAKRNGCFSGCHWESAAPSPPVYGYKQEGPVQFQWVTRSSIFSGDSFFGNPVTSYTPTNPLKPTRLSQPHDGHLICFIASRLASVLLSGVSPKSVSLAREGLTGRSQRNRPTLTPSALSRSPSTACAARFCR